MNDDIANQVLALFHQIDQQTAAFQTETGLQCPPGCGRCCENPEVHVTVLDCVPLAIALFRQKEAENWLAQLEADSSGCCVFYQPDPITLGNGRCGVYFWRPALCRLFGFATVSDKQGQAALAACREHKATQPEVVAQIQRSLADEADDLEAPSFAEFSTQLMAIDPNLGTQLLPINQAMLQALARVGLYAQMEDSEQL